MKTKTNGFVENQKTHILYFKTCVFSECFLFVCERQTHTGEETAKLQNKRVLLQTFRETYLYLFMTRLLKSSKVVSFISFKLLTLRNRLTQDIFLFFCCGWSFARWPFSVFSTCADYHLYPPPWSQSVPLITDVCTEEAASILDDHNGKRRPLIRLQLLLTSLLHIVPNKAKRSSQHEKLWVMTNHLCVHYNTGLQTSSIL